MIYRIFPTKDSFITNAQKRRVPQTGSNFGFSETMEVFKEVGLSGASGWVGSASLARSVMQFDLSDIAALTASGDAPSTGSTYHLKLFDARHAETLPTSFDIEIAPLSRSWDEGSGIDNDTFLDLGVVNWDKAQSSTWWTTPGGDFLSDPTASYSFDRGTENVEVDVSNIVGAWLTGGLDNYGFVIKLTSAEETDGNNYYKKKFHTRETHFLSKRPTLEMRFDDSIKDQRSVFLFDVTSSLYMYNLQRGQLTDITGVTSGPNVITVAIADLSGTIMTPSASHTGRTGIYSASFALPTGSYSGSLFSDMWGINGQSFMTGNFTPHNDGGFSNNSQSEYIVSIKNLKQEYELAEKVRFDMFVRTRNYNPAVVNTGSLVIGNTIIEKGYYRIDDALTDEHVIPLGTGSVETTRLSYDANGNYFEMYMSSLAAGGLYNMVFFFDVGGRLKKINQKFRFKVV